jgi:LacI family transcriptional regulator
MRPTVKDIAREANVSVATVSKIINNKIGGYSEETKAKVLKIVEEQGYEMNAIARGLATKSTRILGVLMPNVATSVYAEVLDGIEDIAHQNGYSVMICNTGMEGVRTVQYLKTLLSNQVDGIIYMSLPLTDEYFEIIARMNTPCVLALTAYQKFQVPYVKVDDRQAAYSATQYLIENGHKHIALIGSKKDEPIVGKPRVEGYLQALSDYGLEVNENLLTFGTNFSYEDGELCMNRLLEQRDSFTAVFAASDDMAIGALNVAHQKGIAIPHDLSIIGYDNTKVAKISYPSLTTVSQPLYQIGKKAVEKLIHIIVTGEKVASSIMMHEIIERETVRSLLNTLPQKK